MGEPSTMLKKYHLPLLKVPWDFLNEPDSKQLVFCPVLIVELVCDMQKSLQSGCTRVNIFLCSVLGLGFEVSLFQRTELKSWIRLSRKFFQLSFNLAMKIKLSTLLHFPQCTYSILKFLLGYMPSFTYKLPRNSVPPHHPSPNCPPFSFLTSQVSAVWWPCTKHCFCWTGGWQCAHSLAPWKPHAKTCFLKSHPTNLLLGYGMNSGWNEGLSLRNAFLQLPQPSLWKELLPVVVWTPCVGAPGLAWC